MTAEEYLVNEYKILKAAHELLAADYERLKERLAQVEDDLAFVADLFEFKESYASGYLSTSRKKDFKRLMEICGTEEETDGDQ